jgi:hypothetical protein
MRPVSGKAKVAKDIVDTHDHGRWPLGRRFAKRTLTRDQRRHSRQVIAEELALIEQGGREAIEEAYQREYDRQMAQCQFDPSEYSFYVDHSWMDYLEEAGLNADTQEEASKYSRMMEEELERARHEALRHRLITRRLMLQPS